jgi:hypothetical protein
MRRENAGRWRNNKGGRRRNGLVKRHGQRQRSSTESGGRTEGSPGSREGGTGSGTSGRTAAVALNGAFRPHTHHPSSFQHCSYSIWFIDSVKGEEEGDGRGFIGIPVCLVYAVVVHC